VEETTTSKTAPFSLKVLAFRGQSSQGAPLLSFFGLLFVIVRVVIFSVKFRKIAMSKKTAEEKKGEKTEYRNEGLLRWERNRIEWKKPDPSIPKKNKSAKTIDPEDIIERIFSHAGNGVLPEPIPLPQMVDILIDFWEADGLYD
jgi:hypothetical protein